MYYYILPTPLKQTKMLNPTHSDIVYCEHIKIPRLGTRPVHVYTLYTPGPAINQRVDIIIYYNVYNKSRVLGGHIIIIAALYAVER